MRIRRSACRCKRHQPTLHSRSTGGAWIEGCDDETGGATYSGLPSAGRRTGGVCSNWTTTLASCHGIRLTEAGGFDSFTDCDQALPIACCNP